MKFGLRVASNLHRSFVLYIIGRGAISLRALTIMQKDYMLGVGTNVFSMHHCIHVIVRLRAAVSFYIQDRIQAIPIC